MWYYYHVEKYKIGNIKDWLEYQWSIKWGGPMVEVVANLGLTVIIVQLLRYPDHLNINIVSVLKVALTSRSYC